MPRGHLTSHKEIPWQTVGRGISIAAAVIVATACAHGADLPVSAGIGPSPTLPAPRTSLIPTVKVAEAVGWKGGAVPTPGSGLAVAPFATGLDHPRWLYVLPNGDVLVAETNAPARPDEEKGIRSHIMALFMKKAGAAAPSANRITLLRDANGDGVADARYTLRDSLNAPFGMALVGNNLYIADTDMLLRFTYTNGATQLIGKGDAVVALPAGPRNHHWTKNVIASPDGSKLYVTVGSNSNAAENGIAIEQDRAAIWEVDPATGVHRIYASGLRNPNGLAWNPETHALWTAVNERDELGSDLVPDYMTSVQDGGFYGWPYSYYGAHIDKRVKPQRPDLVARAIAPDYALGPHTASLGLAASFSADATKDATTDAKSAATSNAAKNSALPMQYRNGMFVGQHGSWNRTPRSGYKVIFVPFANGRPSGSPVDVLTGFLSDDGEARGRPVGVALDRAGALLVADDVGNVVWRITASH